MKLPPRSKLQRGLLGLVVVCTVSVLYAGFSAKGVYKMAWTSPKHNSTVRTDSAHQDKKLQVVTNPAPRRLSHEEVGKRFQERRTLLTQACERNRRSPAFRRVRYNITTNTVSYRPLMDATVRYCPIEKAASTTWTSLFSSIRMEMRRLGYKLQYPLMDLRRAMGRLSENTTESVAAQWEGTKEISFLFVREPYGRLLSAWTDKLFSPNPMFWGSTGRYIVRRFRENPSEHSLKCGHDVTFAEFVKYVIHAQTFGQHRDKHFVPTHDHCYLCEVPYQYIGHVETLTDDMAYLLDVMQSPVEYTQHFDKETIYGNANNGLLYFRKGVLKCMGLDEASRRVWKKLQIRGIISKNESFPLTPGQTLTVTNVELAEAAVAALERSGAKATRRLQKKEALKEAFASVPLSDRIELKKLLSLDFDLFGYDAAPAEVFPKEPYVKDRKFSYFELS